MKRNPNKFLAPPSPSPMLEFISEKELIKERYESLPMGEKSRYVAYASAVWGISETARLMGISVSRVLQSRKMCSHMLQELNYVAMETVAKIYLNKALEIAEKINVDNISDDKKPQAVKALMDACDIARLQCIKTNSESDADETIELFYRVRRRIRQQRDEDDESDGEEDKQDERKTIDITGDIEEVKEDA